MLKVVHDFEVVHTVHFKIVRLYSTNKCTQFNTQNHIIAIRTCLGAHESSSDSLIATFYLKPNIQ